MNLTTEYQLNLFKSETDISNDMHYKSIHRDLATFKSGEDKPIHRWFRLTPSFGPDLVNIILNEFNYNSNSIVLDPFAGAGTTLIECQLNNIKSYGFEINSLDIDNLLELNDSINKCFSDYQKKYLNSDYQSLDIDVPTIHNIERWWRPDVLKDLLILKKAIINETNCLNDIYRDIFLLIVAGILVPDLTNVTLGKLQLHFINRDNDIIDVIKRYNQHFNVVISDLERIKKLNNDNIGTIINIDSTIINEETIKDKIDFVITSPPYPNRYSYVWNTRPYLYFFDFFNTPKEAADLDKKTIGGTWGTATSILAKGKIEPLNEVVDDYASEAVEKIREYDNLMANYVMKYFNLLTQQIIKMKPILCEDPKLAYVVGVSDIKGVRVSTDEILSNIFKGLEYNSKIVRFRKRNSGKDLYESIVFAQR